MHEQTSFNFLCGRCYFIDQILLPFLKTGTTLKVRCKDTLSYGYLGNLNSAFYQN